MPDCDCERLGALLIGACKLDQSVPTLPGERTSPPPLAAPSALALPQPLRIELTQPDVCAIEDPDLRPYVWDCHD